MTTREIRRMFRYNAWANGRCLAALEGVPAEALSTDLKGSHGTLHGTMLHVVWAHDLWLLRWMGRSNEPAAARAAAAAGLEGLRDYWHALDRETAAFLDERLTDAFLAQTFTMKTTKGEPFTHTYGEAMLHLINHSTYHRGQFAALLRQSGFVPPATDFILFARTHPDSSSTP